MARNTSRFSRLLNLIGLVDETDDREYDYDGGRPRGADTYPPAPRRNQPQSGARPMREEPSTRYQPRSGGNYYDDRQPGRSQPRYQDEPRDYRRNDAGYSQSRAQSTQQRRAPEQDRYQPRQDYARQQDAGYQPRAIPPRQPQPERQPARPRYEDDYQAPPQREYTSRASRREAQPPQPEEHAMRVRPEGPSAAAGRMETVIVYLHKLEECREVIMALLENKSVLLNLEDMDERLVQRGIDTLGGAAFALDATLRKASDKTYLIAPNSVTVRTDDNDSY